MRNSGIDFSGDSGTTINTLEIYLDEKYGGIVNNLPAEQKIEPVK